MAVEYIRGLQRLLAEADGIEYDPCAGLGHNVPSPTSSIVSSSHNGSGERLILEDDGNADEEDGEGLRDDDDEEDGTAKSRATLGTRQEKLFCFVLFIPILESR